MSERYTPEQRAQRRAVVDAHNAKVRAVLAAAQRGDPQAIAILSQPRYGSVEHLRSWGVSDEQLARAGMIQPEADPAEVERLSEDVGRIKRFLNRPGRHDR